MALPLLTYLLCIWGAATGDRYLAVAAAVAGCFVVQTHIATAPAVVAAAMFTIGWRVVQRLRHDASPIPRPWILATAAVVVVLWSGPLLNQITADEGNLTSLVEFFLDDHDTAGWTAAGQVAGNEFGISPPWLGASEVDEVGFVYLGDSLLQAVAVTLLVAALGVIAWRSGERNAAAMAWFAAGLVPVSIVAMARTVDGMSPYLLRWTWVVAAFLALAGVFAACRSFGRAGRGTVALAATGLTLLMSTLVLRDAISIELPESADARVVAALSEGTRNQLHKGGSYSLISDDPYAYYTVSTGLASDLIRHGWNVRMPPGTANRMGRRWTARPATTDRTLLVRSTLTEFAQTAPEGRLIARYDPLSPTERAEAGLLAQAIRDQTDAGPNEPVDVQNDYVAAVSKDLGAAPEAVDRLRRLQASGPRYEVWLSS